MVAMKHALLGAVLLLSICCVVESVDLKQFSNQVESKVSPLINWFTSSNNNESPENYKESNIKKTFTNVVSQLQAVKESVQNLRRGGNIKNAKSEVPAVSQAETNEKEVVPVEPESQENTDDTWTEVPSNIQEEYGLTHQELDMMEQLIMLEALRREEEVNRLLQQIQYANTEAKYVDEDQTNELATSVMYHSRSGIRGCHSAAQVTSLTKYSELYAESSLPHLQQAYEDLVLDAQIKMDSFFGKLRTIPQVESSEKYIEAPSETKKKIGLSIDVIITLESDAPIIDPQTSEPVKPVSECLNKFVENGELTLSGNGMVCSEGAEDCKQCLSDIFQLSVAKIHDKQ